MTQAIDYAVPGPLTSLRLVSPPALAGLPAEAADICWPVHELVIQPRDDKALAVPADRLAESQLRRADRIVDALLALDPAPLEIAREPGHRVIGTCRHFAVLSCALLRYRGIAARVRCGFATYFQSGQGLDHWITEYRQAQDARWVRIDTEILGQQMVTDPGDLRAGEFLTGGEAWTAFRDGEIDAATFGVYETGNWGPAEIRGNAIRDLAALNKVEMLPWDEWGRMGASYHGQTGSDYDEIIDTIAAVCAGDDPAAVAALYAVDDLRVPPELMC